MADINLEIPVPLTFNPHKHHFVFLTKKIKIWQKQEWYSVKEELLCIGNNMIDLYLGKLEVSEICFQCISYFKEKKISKPCHLRQWLHPLEYRKIKLTDNSVWIIKTGMNNDRFIHIHPAKNAPCSIRIKGTTLKTVLALKVHTESLSNDLNKDLKIVNDIRTKYLDLSPVKTLPRGKGISRLWEQFNLPELNQEPMPVKKKMN